MKVLLLLKTDFKRMFLSKYMLFSVLGVTAMMFAGTAGWLNQGFTIWDLMYNAIQGNGNDIVILCILPVIPFALSYAREKEENAVRYWVIRCGINRYACSKIIIGAIGGLLTVFLGILLFVVILLPQIPVYEIPIGAGYELLMEEGHFAAGILLFSVHHGLSGMIAAIYAIWFSTLLPNPFASAAAPLVLNFALCRITNRIHFNPEYLAPVWWISGVYEADTPGQTIFIKLATAFTIGLVLGVLAKINMGRRLSHE